MSRRAHLWAVGFDDVGGADEVRQEITRLAWEKHKLELLDLAVAVRYPDGCFTLSGEPFPAAIKIGGGTVAHMLAGLALAAPPLSSAAIRPLLAGVGATADIAGISEAFVREVGCLMKPGSSVLFVLDNEGDMGAILRGIRGLDGTVLKTNVDVERAKLIQSTLAAKTDIIELR